LWWPAADVWLSCLTRRLPSCVGGLWRLVNGACRLLEASLWRALAACGALMAGRKTARLA